MNIFFFTNYEQIPDQEVPILLRFIFYCKEMDNEQWRKVISNDVR